MNGIENFKEVTSKDYYYIDKSDFIQIVLNDKVSLFTLSKRLKNIEYEYVLLFCLIKKTLIVLYYSIILLMQISFNVKNRKRENDLKNNSQKTCNQIIDKRIQMDNS